MKSLQIAALFLLLSLIAGAADDPILGGSFTDSLNQTVKVYYLPKSQAFAITVGEKTQVLDDFEFSQFELVLLSCASEIAVESEFHIIGGKGRRITFSVIENVLIIGLPNSSELYLEPLPFLHLIGACNGAMAISTAYGG